MEIRDLEYFLACCETRSFTAAARQAHIVQSAMSSAIGRLERDLGVSLFDRSATPIAVTEQGEALRLAAQRVLEGVQAARDQVLAVSGRTRGTVVLGSTLNTGPLDLVSILSGLRARYPEVVIHLRQSSTGSAGNLSAVLEGGMDIALTASTAHPLTGDPPSGVLVHPLVSEALVFVCRTDHPLVSRSAVSPRDLADETILRFPPGWGVRDTVDRVLGAQSSAMEIADYALMTKLVRGGFGTTLMPASAVSGVRGLSAVPVDDHRMHWDLAAAISANRPPTAATAAVLDALIRAAAAEAGP
jgi:DNA-binding transcriptional LysR family regulator